MASLVSDYYKLLGTIPGEKAYFTLEQSGCKLGG